MIKKILTMILVLFVSACGGGSSSPPEPPTPPPPSASISVEEAARFLTQATFGPKMDEINSLADSGYQLWLDQQFTMPPSLHLPLVLEYPK